MAPVFLLFLPLLFFLLLVVFSLLFPAPFFLERKEAYSVFAFPERRSKMCLEFTRWHVSVYRRLNRLAQGWRGRRCMNATDESDSAAPLVLVGHSFPLPFLAAE